MELNSTALNVVPFILWLYTKSFSKVILEQLQQTSIQPQRSDLSRTIQPSELMEFNEILLQIELKRTKSCVKESQLSMEELGNFNVNCIEKKLSTMISSDMLVVWNHCKLYSVITCNSKRWRHAKSCLLQKVLNLEVELNPLHRWYRQHQTEVAKLVEYFRTCLNDMIRNRNITVQLQKKFYNRL